MTPFAKFMSINNLKRKDIASFLGVSGAFITQISSGDRPLPEEKLATILTNAYGWDTSMLTEPEHPEVSKPNESSLVDYLERKVSDQEILIRELYHQIWMLEAKLDLAQKGEIARTADGSSVVKAG